jgi:hypothetical protein
VTRDEQPSGDISTQANLALSRFTRGTIVGHTIEWDVGRTVMLLATWILLGILAGLIWRHFDMKGAGMI